MQQSLVINHIIIIIYHKFPILLLILRYFNEVNLASINLFDALHKLSSPSASIDKSKLPSNALFLNNGMPRVLSLGAKN